MMPRKDAWTDWELTLLRRLYPHERTEDAAKQIGRKATAVNSKAHKMGIKKTTEYLETQLARFSEGGKKHRIQKGSTPPNKGKRMPGYAPGRMGETQFKPGHKNATEVEVGTIKKCRKHGRLEGYKRKMCMDCRGGRQWMALQRWVWMQHNGPIPKGHVIRVDGWDPDDPLPPEEITIERLECLTLRQNMIRNSIHRYPKEIVDAVMQAGRLQREINKQRKNAHGKK